MSRHTRFKEKNISGFSTHKDDSTKMYISDIKYKVKEGIELKDAIEEQRNTFTKKYSGVFEVTKKEDGQLGFGNINIGSSIMINNNRLNDQQKLEKIENKRLLKEGVDIINGSGLWVKKGFTFQR